MLTFRNHEDTTGCIVLNLFEDGESEIGGSQRVESYCEANYISETERALKQRLKEYQKDSSPVGHHMEYNKHELDSKNIRIVDRDSSWYQRGVREAIQIRSRSPPSNVTEAGTTSHLSTTRSCGQVTRA